MPVGGGRRLRAEPGLAAGPLSGVGVARLRVRSVEGRDRGRRRQRRAARHRAGPRLRSWIGAGRRSPRPRRRVERLAGPARRARDHPGDERRAGHRAVGSRGGRRSRSGDRRPEARRLAGLDRVERGRQRHRALRRVPGAGRARPCARRQPRRADDGEVDAGRGHGVGPRAARPADRAGQPPAVPGLRPVRHQRLGRRALAAAVPARLRRGRGAGRPHRVQLRQGSSHRRERPRLLHARRPRRGGDRGRHQRRPSPERRARRRRAHLRVRRRSADPAVRRGRVHHRGPRSPRGSRPPGPGSTSRSRRSAAAPRPAPARWSTRPAARW